MKTKSTVRAGTRGKYAPSVMRGMNVKSNVRAGGIDVPRTTWS